MSPERPNLILSPDIPNIELDVLIGDCLDVESHCRDSCHILVQLQLVQYRRLSGCVQAKHQQSHFFGSEDLAHHLADLSTHCAWLGMRLVEDGSERGMKEGW